MEPLGEEIRSNGLEAVGGTLGDPEFKDGFRYEDLKDYFRRFKHNGYLSNSRYRKKFVAQNYIEGLKGDWKILIYSDL